MGLQIRALLCELRQAGGEVCGVHHEPQQDQTRQHSEVGAGDHIIIHPILYTSCFRCSPKDWQDKISRAANIQNIPSLTVTGNHDSSPESDIVKNNDSINANGEKGKKIVFMDT